MLGAVVSTTETVCVAVAELPDESVAVHVTVVSPSENESGASLVTVFTSIISSAMAAPNCISVTKGAVASTTISEGENISGTVVSTIVTV